MTAPPTGPGHEGASCEHPQELVAEKSESFPERTVSLVSRALVLPLLAYRRWVSPALPARCRFYPTCSAYAIEALRVHGPIRGMGLVCWRLLRCQPFHPGGYDPVPDRSAPRRRWSSARTKYRRRIKNHSGASRWISTST